MFVLPAGSSNDDVGGDDDVHSKGVRGNHRGKDERDRPSGGTVGERVTEQMNANRTRFAAKNLDVARQLGLTGTSSCVLRAQPPQWLVNMHETLRARGIRVQVVVTDHYANGSDAARRLADWLTAILCSVERVFSTTQVGNTCGYVSVSVAANTLAETAVGTALVDVNNAQAASLDQVQPLIDHLHDQHRVKTSHWDFADDSWLMHLAEHKGMQQQIKICTLDQACAYLSARLSNINAVHGTQSTTWIPERVFGYNVCSMLDCGNGQRNLTNFKEHDVEPSNGDAALKWVADPLVLIVNTQDSNRSGEHWFTVAMQAVPVDQ